MGYFFFDIETFIDESDKASGLNPYKNKSKIISIAYNYYNEFSSIAQNYISINC